MAGQTFKYGNACQQFGTAQWNWTALAVNAMLVNALYTPNINGDVHVSDIPAAAILIRDIALTNLGMANGIASGIIPTFNSFLSPTPVAAVVLYVRVNGNDAASQLIYYSSSGIGFPFLAQGFNYAVVQDLTNGGWFQV